MLFHVVSTYKKGDPSQLDNCRPISLLNACYELRAELSRERLDKGLDNRIPSTQYGTHNSQSTAQTIYIARRLQDYCVKSATLHVILLYQIGKKAFAKVRNKK